MGRYTKGIRQLDQKQRELDGRQNTHLFKMYLNVLLDGGSGGGGRGGLGGLGFL
jgi:hypothetical protein